MLHLNETPSRSKEGRIAIICPHCKNFVFNGKGISVDNEPRLEWHCVYCQAVFSSYPPFEEAGEDKESFKEKIINRLLEEGRCEEIVKIFAVASKKPPEFREKALRELLKDI